MLKNSACRLRGPKGVTLVEVMIALVILLLVFMGLLQAALLSVDHNLRNIMRDEAVRIADQRMNGRLDDSGGTRYDGLRIISFQALDAMATGAAWTAPVTVQRNFRDVTRPFSVCWRITRLGDSETIRIQVAVGWNHRGEIPLQGPTGTEYVHQITTLRRT